MRATAPAAACSTASTAPARARSAPPARPGPRAGRHARGHGVRGAHGRPRGPVDPAHGAPAPRPVAARRRRFRLCGPGAHNGGAPMNADDIRRMVADSVALKQRFFEEKAPQLLDLGQRDRRPAARRRAPARVRQRRLGRRRAALRGRARGAARPTSGRALSAIALTTDPSIVTAAGNDLGFASVFRRQVEAHGRPGDVALGISTSGRSPNVVEALRAARALGLHTIGLTGNGGATVATLVDDLVDVPHTDTQRIQEVHGMVLHVLGAGRRGGGERLSVARPAPGASQPPAGAAGRAALARRRRDLPARAAPEPGRRPARRRARTGRARASLRSSTACPACSRPRRCARWSTRSRARARAAARCCGAWART